MPDEEREAATGAQERIEPLADELVVAGGRRGRILEEQVSGEHPGLEPVVDALTVHRVDQSGGIADRHPSGPWRRTVLIGSRHARGRSRLGPRSQSSCTRWR
jgi:hypothetical protein